MMTRELTNVAANNVATTVNQVEQKGVSKTVKRLGIGLGLLAGAGVAASIIKKKRNADANKFVDIPGDQTFDDPEFEELVKD